MSQNITESHEFGTKFTLLKVIFYADNICHRNEMCTEFYMTIQLNEELWNNIFLFHVRSIIIITGQKCQNWLYFPSVRCVTFNLSINSINSPKILKL
jgi:hypothetical protein